MCDFAEVYGVYDIRALPPRTAAVLACGLPESSRAKLKAYGRRFSFDQRLMMMIYDRLNILCWRGSRNAQYGIDPPQPLENVIEQSIMRAEGQSMEQLMGFDSPGELMKYLGHGGEDNG